MRAQELVHNVAEDIMTLYPHTSDRPPVELAQLLERGKDNSTHHSSWGDANVVGFEDSVYKIAEVENFSHHSPHNS